MPQESKKYDVPADTPAITMLLVVSYIYVFIQASSTGLVYFFHHNCANIAIIQTCISQSHYLEALSRIAYSTLADLNQVQLVVSIYFSWSLGKSVETFFNSSVFLIFIITTVLISWGLMFFFPNFFEINNYNIGPTILNFALLGAGILIPGKKEDYSIVDRTKILNRTGTSLMDSLNNIDFKSMLLVYIGIQAGLEYYLRTSQNFKNFISVQPLIAIVAFIVGMIFMAVNQSMASEEAEHRPMRMLAKKMYKKMLTYDLSENEAMMAVSKELQIPYFQIKKWVSKK